jgi:outer membrane protein assembly factor BamA
VDNEIEIKKDSTLGVSFLSKTGVSEDELAAILKQKPNRKIIIGKFHLWLYNRSNQSRIDRRIIVQEEKIIRKNEKIKNKNERKLAKDPYYEPKDTLDRKKTFGESLRSAGEAPVILDSLKILKSVKQMNLYLIKKGYFNNDVTSQVEILADSSEKRRHQQKAIVHYTVTPGIPYKISSYKRQINDKSISEVLKSLKLDSLIKVGNNFDTDVLEAERKRITKHLLDHGYYYFNQEFIFYRVDSTLGNRKVSLSLGIQNFKVKDVENDTLLDKPHKAFRLGTIEVFADEQPKEVYRSDYAKVNIDGIDVYHQYKLKIKPSLIVNSILFKEGELYKKTLEESTYRKFMSLGTYKSVSMRYDTLGGDLNVKIFLEPSKAQTFNVATDGTQTNGLFGIEGSMTYAHSNVFGGAEKLQISISGGIEMQRLVFASDSSSGVIGSDVSSVNEIAKTFNTLEFGPKLSLTIPRMLFIQPIVERIVGRRLSSPKTEFSGSLNFQNRPDFKRSIEEFSFGWIYHEKPAVTIRYSPLIISAISIEKSEEFQQRIDELNDRFLAASYQDHIIAGGKLSYIYNGQNEKKVKNTFYFQTTFESGGNLLRGIYNAIDKPYDNEVTESYDLLNIRFAQFVKFSGDFRYYLPIARKSKVVYRLAGGIGIPLANLSEALPFEKSFFSGGSNGIRAWKARTLGPGSYRDPDLRFDKIGDIQLEGNVEVRFPLISWMEGALFLDAGNIWLLNEDSLRVGGKFDKNEFISEIAFGAGIGLRLDLDFFVIRLDVAAPIKNPSLIKGQRWIWEEQWNDERKLFYRPQFNLGIGYPF